MKTEPTPRTPEELAAEAARAAEFDRRIEVIARQLQEGGSVDALVSREEALAFAIARIEAELAGKRGLRRPKHCSATL